MALQTTHCIELDDNEAALRWGGSGCCDMEHARSYLQREYNLQCCAAGRGQGSGHCSTSGWEVVLPVPASAPAPSLPLRSLCLVSFDSQPEAGVLLAVGTAQGLKFYPKEVQSEWRC